jgi:Ca2+-transporting ATPase
MRVLAMAKRPLPDANADLTDDELERDLQFVGLVGMSDPPRSEAKAALQKANEAGIHVTMLTGDQPGTAASIGSELGLEGPVLTGRDIRDLGGDELVRTIEGSNVFARVTSETKMDIIRAAQRSNKIVAMTGDGVNDAPALRAADIGIAMGKGGTEVAREASDMVLTDDNFSSIVAAIEEGRAIHANIRRLLHFLLACNAAEVAAVFIALVAAGEAMLTPLQILFVNLLTDGLPALALGVEPPGSFIMRQRPRPQGSRLLGPKSLVPILGLGGLIAAPTLVAYALTRSWDDGEAARSVAFATLVCSQLAASVVFRSETETSLTLRRNPWLYGAIAGSIVALLALFAVPLLRDAFDLTRLSAGQWLLVAGLSLVPLAAGEFAKGSGLVKRLHLEPD